MAHCEDKSLFLDKIQHIKIVIVLFNINEQYKMCMLQVHINKRN